MLEIRRKELQGFIIDNHNLKKIWYTDDTELLVDSEWKVQELLDNREEMSTGSKNTEYIIINN